MKKFIAVIAAAGLVLAMSGIAMAGATENRTEVSAISEPGISGNPGIVDPASAGLAPDVVSDVDTTFDYTLLYIFCPAGADAVDLAASAASAPNMVSGAETTYDYTLLTLFSHAEADAIDLATAGGMTSNIGTASLESDTGNNVATASDDGGPRPTCPQRPEAVTTGC